MSGHALSAPRRRRGRCGRVALVSPAAALAPTAYAARTRAVVADIDGVAGDGNDTDRATPQSSLRDDVTG